MAFVKTRRRKYFSRITNDRDYPVNVRLARRKSQRYHKKNKARVDRIAAKKEIYDSDALGLR